MPRGFNYIEAAGIPETYFTVWTKLFDIEKIKKIKLYWCMVVLVELGLQQYNLQK